MRAGSVSSGALGLCRSGEAAACCLLTLVASPSGAAAQNARLALSLSSSDLAVIAVTAAFLMVLAALVALGRARWLKAAAHRRVRELEVELDETTAALTAEPNILLVWRG